MDTSKRICECKDMEEFYTSMSLKATKEGDIAKAKEHARKAQAYLQEMQNLISSLAEEDKKSSSNQ